MTVEVVEALQGRPDWPPMMPWREFADWIRVDRGIVEGWIARAYLPTTRIGKHRVVNLVALIDQLKEDEV